MKSRALCSALRAGFWVLSDRYVLSSLAYQGSALPLRWVEALNAGIARPDLTLFIDVPVKEASRRRAGRGGQPELFEAAARQRKVARIYEAVVRKRARLDRIVRLDGAGTPAEVTRAALRAIGRLR